MGTYEALVLQAWLAKLGAPPDQIMEHFMATLYKRYPMPAPEIGY